MNLPIRPWFFAFLLPAALALFPAEPARAEPVVAYRAKQEGIFRERGFVSIGASREMVTSLLGAPGVTVSDEIWIYWDFRVRPERANPGGFDTLIVRFSGDTVAALKLSDGDLIRRALARQFACLHG